MATMAATQPGVLGGPVPAQPVQAQAQATFQSASLYVGDLLKDVTEGTLFEMFNRVGPVASIRVCRDAVSRISLGYAYVNFHNVQDAERALDTMNFTDIRDRPCRIMWSQRDPSLRKSGLGNVFVKNLAPSVDNKALFDTFSVFGNILSCKVATDTEGVSKGYGYVHYETDEAAKDAINKFNDCFIDDMKVFVGPFVRRQDRLSQTKWTNIYVKQFPTTWDDDQLRALFSPFGDIASLSLSRDADGNSKGFGFVNYVEHESAESALKELANKTIEDPVGAAAGGPATFDLYVNRAQKLSERQREINNKLQVLQLETISKYQGMNLYVKNLDDTVSDALFNETFAKYGTITSARIMRDPTDGANKGFGFVCYSTPEEATRAVQELNGKMLNSKPIFVTLHQRKEQRQAALQAANRMRFTPGPGMQMPFGVPMYPQGNPGFAMQRFPTYPGAAQPYSGRGGRGGPQNMPYAAGPGRGGGGQQPGFYPLPQYGNPQQMQQMGPGGQQAYNRRPMAPGQQPLQSGMGPGGPQQQVQRRQPQGQVPGGRGPMPGGRGPYGPGLPGVGPGPQSQQRGAIPAVNFNRGVRNQGVPQGGQMGQGAPVQNIPMPGLGEPLDDQALAQADPQMQKNMIGERLYPLIYAHQPQQAGKITGMLLEMDNAELLNLIESPDALLNKIEEALTVLKNHQSDDA